ncbi:hypothetical protein, partial [Paraburkholderia sp. XV]|uniref:hypothetical protein n=1 Tax=Paraburkholderia sp. XV TaxID=2831520 RepID=UPI001CD7AEA0
RAANDSFNRLAHKNADRLEGPVVFLYSVEATLRDQIHNHARGMATTPRFGCTPNMDRTCDGFNR